MSDRRQLVLQFVGIERQPPGVLHWTVDMLTWSRHYGQSTKSIQRENVTHTHMGALDSQ